MSLSSSIAKLILEMLEAEDEIELKRNEFAQRVGCVPSQINYVIASRFTPEQGYLVESRRGGGGFIRIVRVNLDRGAMLMHVINNIGSSLDEATRRAHLLNLEHRDILDKNTVALILSATGDGALRLIPVRDRDQTRALIFKKMLLSANNNGDL